MCRKNIFYGGIWLSFGVGLLISLLIESVLLHFLLGAAALAIGFFLCKG